jgi:hypothetical protein
MATIQKTYESDALAANVGIDLRKRTVSDGADPPVYSDEYYGEVLVTFDGGRKSVRKEVKLSELTASQRNALVSGASAMHALAVSKVTIDDLY